MASANVTLTLPQPLITQIDEQRGDVNRSKYVVRLLRKVIVEQNKEAEVAMAK
jgi:metal-responsive CopG/Arc/MetJ family transcriptional regulator